MRTPSLPPSSNLAGLILRRVEAKLEEALGRGKGRSAEASQAASRGKGKGKARGRKMRQGEEFRRRYNADGFSGGRRPSGPVLNPPAQGNTASPAFANPSSGQGGFRVADIPFISQDNPNGAGSDYVNGSLNCGPASMAMLARAFGMGGGMSDAQLVNHFNMMDGTRTGTTTIESMMEMARSLGKSPTQVENSDLSFTDKALAAGQPVVAFGDLGYGNHYVVVTGKDAQGNYTLRDPADPSRTSLSPEQFKRFMEAGEGGWQMAVG
jgi:hypothetical protein